VSRRPSDLASQHSSGRPGAVLQSRRAAARAVVQRRPPCVAGVAGGQAQCRSHADRRAGPLRGRLGEAVCAAAAATATRGRPRRHAVPPPPWLLKC